MVPVPFELEETNFLGLVVDVVISMEVPQFYVMASRKVFADRIPRCVRVRSKGLQMVPQHLEEIRVASEFLLQLLLYLSRNLNLVGDSSTLPAHRGLTRDS